MKKLDNIKIVFIDIDKTLLNDKGHITLRIRKSIKKLINRGIYVVITSGRSRAFCVDKSKRSLASSIVINSNGAEIFDYDKNKVLWSSYINKRIIREIFEFCDKNKLGIIFNSGSHQYINKYLIDSKNCDLKVATSDKEVNKHDISQFTVVAFNDSQITKVKDKIKILNLDVAYISPNIFSDMNFRKGSIDVINKGVAKGTAVKELLTILNIKKEEALCFGDYKNDLEMFDACGYKVAMGNACDELKKKADFVTLSNNKNGVAYFLNKYL